MILPLWSMLARNLWNLFVPIGCFLVENWALLICLLGSKGWIYLIFVKSEGASKQQNTEISRPVSILYGNDLVVEWDSWVLRGLVMQELALFASRSLDFQTVPFFIQFWYIDFIYLSIFCVPFFMLLTKKCFASLRIWYGFSPTAFG